jgi:hypothetical protein
MHYAQNSIQHKSIKVKSLRRKKKITGDHQRGFLRQRSATDLVLCIRQIREKKWV